MTTDSPRISRTLMLLFATTIFTSAFLLFQVQPLISKFILPWFGGSPAVWSTCMLFFQVTLFAGYVYAHLTTQHLSPRWQAGLHIALLVIATMILPITPDDSWKPDGSSSPAFRIVALLTMCVGLPYFILSSTGPLLQRWFSLQAPGVSPYRLYALSNVGSLLALISFPFVFEPVLASHAQASIWSWGFRAFAVFCAACACRLFRMKNLDALLEAETRAENALAVEDSAAPTWADRATWFGLAMVASVMLLATTNQVCMDVATVPFLWILPLTLYLMSFILCFDADRWYSRKWYMTLLGVTFLGVLKTLLSGTEVSIVLQVSVYLSAMFCCCMVCHGELAQQKPGTRHLTQFFLLMSAGGAGGGLFVGLIAPHAFPAYWELHIGIVACLLITLLVLFRDRTSYLYKGQPRPAWMMIGLWVSLVAWSLQCHARDGVAAAIEVSRNFYGVLQVRDQTDDGDAAKHRRGMFHGSILHGTQFLADDKRDLPTTYYGKKSGVGLVMQHHRAGQKRRIGVVGLGVGTLAAYGQKQDTLRFYEINSEVIRLADRYFTFLKNSPGQTEMVLGDARLSLEHEAPQNYDILVLDAFSGDAIPTHLLTREAAELYQRNLSDDGILCIHISNLHFDLRPVVLGLANELELHSVCVRSMPNETDGTNLCDWTLLSRKPIPETILSQAEVMNELGESELLWTDEWSNLLSVLR
ncbi:MAG: fused MFS/spermidine synthase [Rhodopirellula sp.]|nr:fused MFS/spermidine synthase [Rhodopirellula sp.]